MDYQSRVLNQAGNQIFAYAPDDEINLHISGGEYLPRRANVDDYIDKVTGYSDGIVLIGYNSRYNDFVVQLINSGFETAIEVPRINYKGYQATHLESGEKMTISDGKSGRIKIDIPAGFSGTISIKFISPWYWRLAELVSLLTLSILILSNTKYYRTIQKGTYNISSFLSS